jgi:hypothetical protein
MRKKTKKNILENGACGCPIPYEHISRISEMVKEKYDFSAPEFWMWKMFQFGYAYGKGRK